MKRPVFQSVVACGAARVDARAVGRGAPDHAIRPATGVARIATLEPPCGALHGDVSAATPARLLGSISPTGPPI
jgi:hypothetical protein